MNAGLVRSMGAAMFMGMMDTSLANRYAGGPLQGGYAPTSRVRQPGAPRPAFHALKLVAEKIAAYRSVERVEFHKGVWAYCFETAGGPLWVLWYDDGQLHLPGDPLPAVVVDLPLAAERALITRTPTASEQTQPDVQTISPSGGVLSLSLDSTPIFVQPAL